jgi:hypothetical protein
VLACLEGVAAMVWFCGRMSGSGARFFVLLFTLVNVPVMWTFAQVRTEPPAIPLILIASIAVFLPKRSALAWSLAPCLLVWATSVRLTNAGPLIAVCLLTAFELRRSPRTLLSCFAIVGANGLAEPGPKIQRFRPNEDLRAY